MPSRKVTRPDDKRIKANLPPERRARRKAVAQKSRWEQLKDGDITVDDLDDEEVMAGRTKDRNGKFSGRPPDKLPRAIADALRRRWFETVQQSLNDSTDLAIATLQEVMASRMAAAPARVRAAEIILERNLGKVPDKVQATVEVKKFEEDVEGLLVDAGADNVYEITTAKARKEATDA